MTLIELKSPYGAIAAQHVAGLNAISSVISPGMTIYDLISEITNYVTPIYFPSPTAYDEVQFSPIIFNAIDSYVESDISGYTDEQNYYLDLLRNGIFQAPIDKLYQFFVDFQENVLKSNLSKQQQIPLLIAEAIVKASYLYWKQEIENPSSAWYSNGYFESSEYKNYLNLPHWLDATTVGVLTSANMAHTYGQLDPPRIIGVDIVSALTASLGLSAGVVMFKWLPKIHTSISVPSLGESLVARIGGVDYNDVAGRSFLFIFRCRKRKRRDSFGDYTCNSCVTTVPAPSQCTLARCNDDPNCPK